MKREELSQHIGVKVAPEMRQRWDLAAKLMGAKLSTFVRAATDATAKRVLEKSSENEG